MVGVRMGIEDPLQGEAVSVDIPQQSIGGCRSCRTRSWIKIKDRIDDSRSSCDWVGDNILDATSCCLVESSHNGFHPLSARIAGDANVRSALVVKPVRLLAIVICFYLSS